ncbi:MAG: serpin family protein [Caldilineales bacterium]
MNTAMPTMFAPAFDNRFLVDGNTAFAVDLYHKLRLSEGNLFFSPYSISTALAMTYGGARGNTEVEMARTLHFAAGQEVLHPVFAELGDYLDGIQNKGHITLHTANSLWPQEGYRFLETYLELCRWNYGVTITPVNYERDREGARRTINAWVEKKTNDKIKDLLKPPHVTPNTTLILVNAIYFKGNWASRFDKNRTEDATFRKNATDTCVVPMMTQTETFNFARGRGIQVLSMPYVGEDLSMVIFLPDYADGLTALEDQLSTKFLEFWMDRLYETRVHVFLPRFRLTGAFELNKTLESLGMVDAFGPADFSGMTGQRDLFISYVVHKAFVDVNEEGTEAAAATAVAMSRSVPAPPPTFRADHPFLFLIRENATGSVLFLGRVVDPTDAE